MEKKKKIQISALAAGTLMVGAFAGSTQAKVISCEDLGTGAELRNELLANHNPVGFFNHQTNELKCGEGKCGEKEKADKKAEGASDETKASEHKCGEGKCGEKGSQADRDAAREKAEKREEGKEKEGKATEHKCGEGKCGN